MGIELAIRRARRADNLFAVFAFACTSVAAVAFYGAGARACHGDFPVPLDDTFIHFDFARAACRGHPFEWIAGQGYSSGETSPLYALVLAVGWAIGFRGASLAYFAAAIACASIASAMVSVRDLVKRDSAAYVGAALVVAVGAVDFALFSGMEVALFVALLLRAFVLADRLTLAAPAARASKQWRLGLLGVALVWTRPEAAVVIAVLSVFAARHARSQSPFGALVRVALPGALATLAVATLNRAMTGDFASAGARLKLVSSNPYLGDLDRAREVLLNALHFEWKVIEGSVAATLRACWVLFVLALVPLASRRTRELGAVIVSSAFLWTLLVSFNGAARYQGFRYYAPSVVMLLVAIALGLSVMARPIALAIGAFVVGGAVWRAPLQLQFFADASGNIHDQQVVVGNKLRTLGPPGARVLLGDAGAIPYFSDRGALDALGLGGFRHMSFTRAALSGEASTLELLQRIDRDDRPELVALYPNWFPFITSHFAREIDRVTIEHNVICGGPTKIIGRADWSALDGDAQPANTIDELDVADVDSERAHEYESPAPRGGWAVANIEDGVFDGGRVIPAGTSESFVANVDGAVAIVMRSDEPIDARVNDADLVAPRDGEHWIEATSAPIAITRGARVVITARAPLRDFHVWLVARR